MAVKRHGRAEHSAWAVYKIVGKIRTAAAEADAHWRAGPGQNGSFGGGKIIVGCHQIDQLPVDIHSRDDMESQIEQL